MGSVWVNAGRALVPQIEIYPALYLYEVPTYLPCFVPDRDLMIYLTANKMIPRHKGYTVYASELPM